MLAASIAFMMDETFDDDHRPPPMHPNRIEAAFVQMRNDGQFYVPQLGATPITIHAWREREIARWNQCNVLPSEGNKP